VIVVLLLVVGFFGGEEGLIEGLIEGVGGVEGVPGQGEKGAKTHTHLHIHRQSGKPQTCTAGDDDVHIPQLHRSLCQDRLSGGGDRCRQGPLGIYLGSRRSS
jgi:hypothetical protein